MISFFSWLFSLITFPGVVVHEIAHRIFCDFFAVPVYAVNYFNFTTQTAGSVTYKRIYSLTPTFYINIGPLIINTLGCILLTLPYQVSHSITGSIFTSFSFIKLAYLLLAWVGISLGIHALPSNYDMKNIIEVLNRRKKKPLFIHSLVIFIESLSPLRRLGLDLVYAYFLSNLILFYV